jgi:hypothetical protein
MRMRPARLAAGLVPVALLAVAGVGRAADEPVRLELEAGEAAAVCGKLVQCPAQTAACDDPKVAKVEIGAKGAEVRAVAPGTTLCGIVAANGQRRVLRVTVKAPPKG